jgi:hypothetical protein
LSQQGLNTSGRMGHLQSLFNTSAPDGNQPAMQQQEGLSTHNAAGPGSFRGGAPAARLFGAGGDGLSGGLGGFGVGAAPSDPVTYQMQAQLDKDGVPNMGDVQQEEDGLAPPPRQQPRQQQQHWNIPAVHTTPGSANRHRASGVSHGGKRALDKKPGAAFKLGKRQAYLKYLAYEVGDGAEWDCRRRACWLPGCEAALEACHRSGGLACRAAGSCASMSCWEAARTRPPLSSPTAAAR